MNATSKPMRCYVRCIDDIQGTTRTLETDRETHLVFFDLAKLVRMVNHRRDETIKVSLHMLRDQIVLHWHCPDYCAEELALEIVQITAPLRNVEALIQGRATA